MNTTTRAAKSGPLKGRRVAILATDGFEQPEDIPAFNKKMIEAIAEGAPSARMDRSTAEI